MRYLIPAIVLVGAIIGGLLYMPDSWRGEPTEVSEKGTKSQGEFVDLAPPAEPDYKTVVTDEALAQELAAEAESYLNEISDAQAKPPLLLTSDSKLEWAGEDSSVAEWLSRFGIEPQANALYYAHPVTTEDTQGVWGIVQGGLISRFAEGIAVRRGENQHTYSVLIPKHADERNADGSSSFLGKVIWHKTQSAQVINIEEGWARNSGELVLPYQDLVIVSFDRQELVAVYQYFALKGQP